MFDIDAKTYFLKAVVLPQEHGSSPFACAFFGYLSRTLHELVQHHTAAKRECLAVVTALQSLPPFYEEKFSKARLDHNTLECMLNCNNQNKKVLRRRLGLSRFNYVAT